MAVDAMELIYNPCIDALTLMTRDLIVIGADPGFSAALQIAANLCNNRKNR
jgi:hypothetical protein